MDTFFARVSLYSLKKLTTTSEHQCSLWIIWRHVDSRSPTVAAGRSGSKREEVNGSAVGQAPVGQVAPIE
jgi:hypothetical protein